MATRNATQTDRSGGLWPTSGLETVERSKPHGQMSPGQNDLNDPKLPHNITMATGYLQNDLDLDMLQIGQCNKHLPLVIVKTIQTVLRKSSQRSECPDGCNWTTQMQHLTRFKPLEGYHDNWLHPSFKSMPLVMNWAQLTGHWSPRAW